MPNDFVQFIDVSIFMSSVSKIDFLYLKRKFFREDCFSLKLFLITGIFQN